MKICPHVIRTIEDWACTNAKSPFSVTPRKRRGHSNTGENVTTQGESPLGKQMDDKDNKERDRLKTPKTSDSTDLDVPRAGPGPRAVTQHLRHRSKNAVMRGVLPTNKNPI
jgi:hypothetical protein